MKEYQGSDSVLVDHVDCTEEGKTLCQKHSVRGYPTIKWGDPEDLQDYQGQRSLEALLKFAQENLGPLKEKTPLEKAMQRAQKAIKPLKDDIDHILKFRKNAAAVLLVGGILIGLILGRCCCARRAAVDAKKKEE
mmetsp:Transcript_132649/g.343262  ORF Transcript_132649/g.343262 Transcript_132649/m.343262 type:complete len:135 (-) Transcript_132649:24-428(-)